MKQNNAVSIQEKGTQNPLGYEKVGKLLFRFAVPSIISGLVGALYNIVDQIFIGQGVGVLGNAATNVAFPIVTISVSIALLFGIGGASGFSLALGQQNIKKATQIVANCIMCMVVLGLVLLMCVLVFLTPLLLLFGSSADVLPYAVTYTGITAFGIPFFIISTGFVHLIRADGNPKYSMFCVLIGVVLNTLLDPLFIFVFDMGMAGAAWATVLGQTVSAILCFSYLFRFRHIQLTKQNFIPNFKIIALVSSLGLASCVNQLAITITQIIMNNTLTYYGASSIYGSSIPLAAVGVISKVNFIFLSITIGIAQGNQPIVGYNYGAGQYARVRKTYYNAIIAATVAAGLGSACFQLFPQQIISLFGSGSELYYQFSVQYLRTFMLMFILVGIQPVTSSFFTSIGKAKWGAVLALSRQILVLCPLLLLFPLFFGISGVMYAGPLADTISAVLAFFMIRRELRSIKKLEK